MIQKTTQRSPDHLLRVALALAGLVFVLGCPGFGELESEVDVSEDDPLCVSVQTILEARCTRCHSAEPAEGAPAGMRLDVFEDGQGFIGAVTLSPRIAARAGDGTMPPAGAPEGRVSDAELAILRAWDAAGAPIVECTGAGSGDVGLDVGIDGSDAGFDGGDAGSDATDTLEIPDIAAAPPTLEEVHAELLISACGSHHLDGTVRPWLGYDDDLVDRLLGDSIQLPSMPWVTPGDSSESYLYHKISGTHLEVGGAGSRMPIGPPLTEAEIEFVRRWIDEGLAE